MSGLRRKTWDADQSDDHLVGKVSKLLPIDLQLV